MTPMILTPPRASPAAHLDIPALFSVLFGFDRDFRERESLTVSR